jgi:hypothetical protein
VGAFGFRASFGWRFLAAAAVVIATSACGQPRSAEQNLESGPAIPSSDPNGKSDSGATSGAFTTGEVASTGADDEPMFDVGSDPDAGVPQAGCRAVDFLFVVDNSGSMSDDQRNLIDNFPTFIEGIETSLDQVDSMHVGIVTSDDYVHNAAGCDSIGGLVTRTGGEDSSARACGPFAAGHNFMTEADDLPDAFACAALVGTEGSHQERPMEAMLRALDGSHAGPGGCNEGFLRDDALLVVVVITDEADGPGDPEHEDHDYPVSPGGPQDWYDAVAQAKGGRPENAVVLSFVHFFGGACPPPSSFTDPAFFDGKNMVDFATYFEDNGFVRGICSDYGPVFDQAVGIVDDACDGFVPAG